MKINPDEERIREIERAQEALRASIDDTRRLSEKVQELLERRRARTASGPRAGVHSRFRGNDDHS